MAFRVALTILGLIALAAFPASAQFSTTDLAGAWIVHGSRVGLMPGADTGWLQGVVTFDAGGTVVDAEVFDQGENFADLTPGALTVAAGGDVAGRLGSASIRGRIAAGKMQIVGVATADEGDADETNAVFILVKQSTGGFGQADATGTWRVNTLLVPERSAAAEYVFGQIVVDGEGAITGGALTSSDGSSTAVLEGSLSVNPDGTFGGQLDIGPLGGDHSFFSGTFTPDKGVMVGATSRVRANDGGHGMFVLQREPDAVYDPVDTTGTWDLFSVQARNDDGSVGAWLSGTFTVDGQGLIAGGTLVDGLGSSVLIRWGLLGVSAEGVVAGGLVTEQGVIAVQGSMLPDKAQIVGVDDRAANLLNNGRFDTPDVAGCFTNFTSAPAGFGWVLDGSLGIDVVNGRPDGCWDGFGGTQNPDGIDQSVDIDGDSSISQRVSTVPGQSYGLTLFYSRDPRVTSAPRRGVVTVEGNSTLVSETLVHDVPNSTSDMNWRLFSTVFVADSTVTTLSIGGDASNGTEGFVVDNVTLTGQVQSRGLVSLVRAGGPAPPTTTVQFAQPVFMANERAAGAVITVERSGAPAAFTVPFTVTGITAVADRDFREVAGVLTFTPDTTSRTFTVPLVDDRLVDGDRSVLLSLGPPAGGSTGAAPAAQAAVGSPATATLIIRDDDQPGVVKLSAAKYSVAESAGSVLVRIVRTGAALGGNVSVSYSTGDVGAAGTTILNADTGGAATRVARPDEVYAGFGEPSLSRGRRFAFRASLNSSAESLVAGTLDDLFTVDDTDGPAFDTFGAFAAAGDLDNQVAFLGTEDSGASGLYLSTFDGERGGITRIAGGPDFTALAPSSRVGFETFADALSLDNVGRVAFLGFPGTGGSGIFIADSAGAVTTVVTTGDVFSGFGADGPDHTPVINDAGRVAFTASLAGGGHGIFTGPDPVLHKVIRTGDRLFGATVDAVRLGGMNNAGQIVFTAFLDDEREVVAVATPDP